MLLVAIDAHSKGIEVGVGSTLSASMTVSHLVAMFSTHGIPTEIVSDNGPCFRSKELQQFTENNCTRVIYTTPYHPASNGQAEQAVGVVKKALEKGPRTATLRRLVTFLLSWSCHTDTQM